MKLIHNEMLKKREEFRVVIVGGGFAGRTARRLLSSHFDTVFVDAHGYFEFVPSALRCLVEPSHADKVVLPQPADTVVGTVTSVDAEKVTLATGEVIRFNYCLLCTGSLYTPPVKPDLVTPGGREGRLCEIRKAGQQLAEAKRILVIGGGTVGVELAAEVAGKWSANEKHVTLLTSRNCLLERMPAKAQSYAQSWMERHGVELIFNERVVQWGETVVTESGQRLEADVVYSCIGFQPATQYFSQDAASSAPISVDPATLQVSGYETVFACGDCSNTSEEKTAFAADISAQLAAKNILRHSKQQPLLNYPQDVCQGRSVVPEIACVSLYKGDGILQINNLVMTGTVAALTKSQIEYMQLAVAQERPWAKSLWNLMELSNLWFSKFF